MPDSESIPEYYRPLGYVMAVKKGEEYKPQRNLEEAKATPESYIIMEGDWGGQIYITCPVNLLSCSENELSNLLNEVDSIAWKNNDGEGAGIYYECLSNDSAIPGGMGGGKATEGIWIHPGLISSGLENRIREIITEEDAIID